MARNVRDGRGGHPGGYHDITKYLRRCERDAELRRSFALALQDANDEVTD
jgi:hypothetical protein